jgi:hypothetical protein
MAEILLASTRRQHRGGLQGGSPPCMIFFFHYSRQNWYIFRVNFVCISHNSLAISRDCMILLRAGYDF